MLFRSLGKTSREMPYIVIHIYRFTAYEVLFILFILMMCFNYVNIIQCSLCFVGMKGIKYSSTYITRLNTSQVRADDGCNSSWNVVVELSRTDYIDVVKINVRFSFFILPMICFITYHAFTAFHAIAAINTVREECTLWDWIWVIVIQTIILNIKLVGLWL